MDAGQLTQILVWPIVSLIIVLFFLIYFRDSVKKILEDLEKARGKISPSGLEFDFERRKIEAAAALGAASVSKEGEATAERKALDEERPREIANVINQVKPKILRRLADASILWVDDNPSNNLNEQRSLGAFGIHFTISTSTADALEKIRVNKYDVIISDMGRPDDKQAGYKLLEEKQKLGDTAPFIIYAGSNLPEHKAEARRRGAFGSTNNPQELFQLVLSAIQGE